ncbi:hypothetical protein [Burkholderia glumae]|uniref:hypothetical protein n=1 Tax=Burkholderia glumae TaxID=337 RepID=UPI003B998D2A
MKRSGFAPRKKPLNHGSWSRKSSPLPEGQSPIRRATIKSRVKKPTVQEGSKYLAACRGEPCYLNVCCPWTDWADPTVVPCHDNRLSSGKGMGMKARNDRTVPGCMLCHRWLDQGPASREEKFGAFDQAFARWFLVRRRKMGLTEVD